MEIEPVQVCICFDDSLVARAFLAMLRRKLTQDTMSLNLAAAIANAISSMEQQRKDWDVDGD